MSSSTPPTAPATAAVTPQPEQAKLSELMRVINIFIAPRKTFADIRNAGWLTSLTPLLLLSLSVVAFTYTVQTKVGYEAIVNNRFAHASFLQRATSNMTPEQKQELINKQVASSNRSIYTAPLGNLVFGLIFAGLLLGTFNFGFDAQIKFKTALAVVFYGWLPKLVFSALAIVVMMVGVEPEGFDMENPVATHLGVLLGSNTDHRYLYHLLTGVDLFSFWWVFVMGIGFATVAQKKISTGTAVTVVAAWYVFGTLLRMLLSPVAS
jgi:hypothetical protein